MEKCKCGKEIDETAVSKYMAHDLQKSNKEINFCSYECMESWIKKKQVGMWGTLILGIVLAILLLENEPTLSAFSLFLPYMIRQVAYKLKNIFVAGVVGEIISFAVVMVGTMTIIYPAYKFIQEFIQYRNLLKR